MTSMRADTAPGSHDTVVRVSGELDHTSVRGLAERLRGAVASGSNDVVIDLENCTFVDATALDQLVQSHAAAHRAGRTLVLRHCSPRVERLLGITGLRRVFTVRD